MRPKILSIDEAWKLYRIMGDALHISSEDRVVDVIVRVVRKMNPQSFQEVIRILYGDDVQITPETVLPMLVNGLRDNHMDMFYESVTRIATYGNSN